MSRTYLCKSIVDFVEFIFAFKGEEEEDVVVVGAFIPSTKMIVSMNFNVFLSSRVLLFAFQANREWMYIHLNICILRVCLFSPWLLDELNQVCRCLQRTLVTEITSWRKVELVWLRSSFNIWCVEYLSKEIECLLTLLQI